MLLIMNRKLIFETPAPFISATSWAILDKWNGEIIFAKNEIEHRQIASLTKVMTFYVILDLLQRFNMSEYRELIRVLPSCTQLNGTSANLIPCDYLSI